MSATRHGARFLLSHEQCLLLSVQVVNSLLEVVKELRAERILNDMGFSRTARIISDEMITLVSQSFVS